MLRQRWLTSVLLAFFMLGVMASAQVGNTDDVIENWHGKSICTVRPSACHDEEVIYEFTKSAPGKVTWKADKVVGGTRENMVMEHLRAWKVDVRL